LLLSNILLLWSNKRGKVRRKEEKIVAVLAVPHRRLPEGDRATVVDFEDEWAGPGRTVFYARDGGRPSGCGAPVWE
jgi:hypothetical protein